MAADDLVIQGTAMVMTELTRIIPVWAPEGLKSITN